MKSTKTHSKKKPVQDKAPRTAPLRDKWKPKGLILVYTGGGKGKTTAALGAGLRAVGRGLRVAMVQFIKGSWKTGELEAVKAFGEKFRIYPMGDGFTWDTKNVEQDKASARKAWYQCCKFLHDSEHDLVIFDEINYVLKYEFLDAEEVVREILKKPARKHVILTGGGAPKILKDAADLVTEMVPHKHPFQKGILAQPGIDY